MKLFSYTDANNSQYNERYRLFSDKCSISPIQDIRDILERWFERYPENKKQKLKSRFQTNEFNSSFFELYLHELLLCMGYYVEVEPEIGASTCPDFLASNQAGRQVFYLEAVLTGEPSKKFIGKRILLDTFLKRIFDEPSLNGLSFRLHVNRMPDNLPSMADLRHKLSNWAAGLDVDAINSQVDAFARGLPRYFYPPGTENMEFVPIPKSSELSGQSSRLIPIPTFQLDRGKDTPDLEIQESLKDKVGKYGDLGRPYIIALNVLNMTVGPSDFHSALFRKPVYCPPGISISRGLWTPLVNTRVSAVLIANSLTSETLLYRQDLCLYHNPWAKYPLEGQLAQLPHALFSKDDETITYKDGVHPREILGLPNTSSKLE